MQIFVNLKRFDVPRSRGGVCPGEDPAAWIDGMLKRCIELGLGDGARETVVFLLPESLLVHGVSALRDHSDPEAGMSIGSQRVHWADVGDANFGAFTGSLPASAVATMGCEWAMIGHSEQRNDRLHTISAFTGEPAGRLERQAVDSMMGEEVTAALDSGLRVLLCVGETADERDELVDVLRSQIVTALGGHGDAVRDGRVVLGYEPVWAIGPGKVPPAADEIGRIAATIKHVAVTDLRADPAVVYGGGLKRSNAADIARQPSVDGGLVALTNFDPPVGFDPDELAHIVGEYARGAEVRSS